MHKNEPQSEAQAKTNAKALARIHAARIMYELVDDVGRALANAAQSPAWRGDRHASELLQGLQQVVSGKVDRPAVPAWLVDRLEAQYTQALQQGDEHDPRQVLEIVNLDGTGQERGVWPPLTMAEVLLLEAADLPGHRRYLATIRELGNELEEASEAVQMVNTLHNTLQAVEKWLQEARAHVTHGTTMAERLDKALHAITHTAK
jgi:hypothetical protein